MDFKQLLKELDKLNLPKDKYAISSSGPMAIRKIREAKDIDIVVSDDLWQELSVKYEVKHLDKGDVIDINEHVQALSNFKPDLNLDIRSNNEQIQDAEEFDGYKFVRLEDVIRFKKVIGREKDFKDIDLINNYLTLQDR